MFSIEVDELKRTLQILGAVAFGVLVLACFAANFSFSKASESDVEIRFTVWDGDEALRVIRQQVEEFEKANPGIKVKLENFGDYNLYHQKMLTQYAANVAPDVAMMDPPHFQALAKRGAILNLSEFIAETPGFDLESYYEPIVAAHSYQGNVYVLPRDIAPMGLIYYNKEAFDEAGIPYPDGSWTWDDEIRPELREKDFLWVMDKLSKKSSSPKERKYGMAAGWHGFLTDTMAYGRGLRWADDLEEPTKIEFGDEGWIEVFKLYREWADKGWIPDQNEVSNVAQSTTQLMFVNRKTAMFMSGIWEVPNMRKALIPGEEGFFEWDIALFPAYAKGDRSMASGGSGYCIFSSTKHKEASWKLVQWMSGEPAMKAMARAGIAQPAIQKLALSDVWLPGPDTPLEQRYPANRIATDQAVAYSKFPPSSDLWPEMATIIGGPVSSVYSGVVSVDEALPKARKDAQDRLTVLLQEEKLGEFPWGLGLVFSLAIFAGAGYFVYGREKGQRGGVMAKRDTKSAYWFLFPWLIGMVVFTMGPMILSFLMSFADWDIIQPAKFRGVQNYVEAFTVDKIVMKSLVVTFIYTMVSVPLGIAFGLALAMLLNIKVKGMPLFRAMYYLPSLASLVAASLIWRRIFSPEGGLLNALIYGPDGNWNLFGLGSLLSNLAGTPGEPVNWLGNTATALPALIMMSVWGVGGAMVILLAGLQGIPQHYYEAAVLDGAGPWQKFRNVTFPLLTPAIFFTLITGLIGSFQTFTQALVMTQGGPDNSTMFYMLHLYNQAFASLRMGYASALAWILFVIIMIFTLIQFRMSKWVYYENG